MKRLTDQWKQQKFGSLPGAGAGVGYATGTKSSSGNSDRGDVVRKRLGWIPISKSRETTEHTLPKESKGKDNEHAASKLHGNEKQTEFSFASSFCSDMDAEMFDALERMEQNMRATDATPKDKKGRASSNTSKVQTTPKVKCQVVTDTPKQNNGKRMKTVGNESPSLKTGKRLCVPKENSPMQSVQYRKPVPSENNCKVTANTKNTVSQNKESNCSAGRSNLKQNSTNVNKRQAPKQRILVGADIHNVSWQSPQVASTPQESPKARGKGQKSTTKQTQLFKSLFTVQSPMNMSCLDESLSVESNSNEKNVIKKKINLTNSAKESLRGNVTEKTGNTGVQLESHCRINENKLNQNKSAKRTLMINELENVDSVAGNTEGSHCRKSDVKKTPTERSHGLNKNTTAQPGNGTVEVKNKKDQETLKMDSTISGCKNEAGAITLQKKEGGNHSATATIDDKDERLLLESWGLPDPVLQQYHNKGITTMFPWQAECLCTGDVLAGKNLVYSAPTSAGKTMVAELLVLKRVMETKKKAIVILPFVSVAREKMLYLQQMYQDAGIRVGGFMGSYSPAGGFSGVDVAVCTIEKGNSLINRLLEENKLDVLGIIVVDELHLVGDSHRGYLLELLLTKIHYVTQKEARDKRSATEILSHQVQVVGMSATLPNLELLAKWLSAELFHTDFRPVPLSECVKIGTTVFDSSMSSIRDIDLTLTFKGDSDHVIPLCLETLKNGHSVLIFCPTKNWCEKLSETIAREFYGLLKNSKITGSSNNGVVSNSDGFSLPINRGALTDVVEQLRRSPAGLDTTLGRTIPYGVAFHHAGLTFDERDIVEGAFRQGMLKVLVATSTLSSGVNLPARRVIIRTPIFHGKMIDFLTYKQMIGRAGRKGVDTEGESVLICKPNERSKAVTLVTSSLPPVQSCLVQHQGGSLSSSMKRAVLEIVVSGVATLPEDVAMYASCTLLAASVANDSDQIKELIDACINFLHENEFVSLQKVKTTDGTEVERFCPTQLGSAVLASALSPDEGLSVFAELQKARQCFVLENELHIIYLVTPIYAMDFGNTMDWYQFYCQWERLSPGERRVAELVGVSEGFLTKAIRGRIPVQTSAQVRALSVHKRFYTCLILHDLVNEVPLSDVARKYNCNKGQLQSLQQSAATFAGMVTVFCAKLGWSNLELILGQFQNRLTFGVQRELCDLVRLTLLNGQRARVLYNGGFQTVASLANANPENVEAIFKNSAPFQSIKRQENETEWEAAQRRESRCIWLTGRKGVTEHEAAIAIIEEAKSLLQEELGGIGIQWKGTSAQRSNKNDSNSETEKSEANTSNGSVKCNSSVRNDSVCIPGQSGVTKGPRMSSQRLIGTAKKIRRRTGSGRPRHGSRKSVSPGMSQSVSPKDTNSNSNMSMVNTTACSKIISVVVSPPGLKFKPTTASNGAKVADSPKKEITSLKINAEDSGSKLNNGENCIHKQRPCQITSKPAGNNFTTLKQPIICENSPEACTAESNTVGIKKEEKVGENENLIAEIDKYTEEMFDDSVDDIDIGNSAVAFTMLSTMLSKGLDKMNNRQMTDSNNCVDKLGNSHVTVPGNGGDKLGKGHVEVDQGSKYNQQKPDQTGLRKIDNCTESDKCRDSDKMIQTHEPVQEVKTCWDGNSYSVIEEFIDSFQLTTQMDELAKDAVKTIAQRDSVKRSDEDGRQLIEQRSPELYTEDIDASYTTEDATERVLACNGNKHSHDLAQLNKVGALEISHDTSADLISASNFDRYAFLADGALDDSSVQLCPDDSYKDLRIPYLSGQEALFKKNTVNVSPKPENCPLNKAIEDDMNDTFSCTNILAAEARSCDIDVLGEKKTTESMPASQKRTKDEEMNDSITLSMMENLLVGDVSECQEKQGCTDRLQEVQRGGGDTYESDKSDKIIANKECGTHFTKLRNKRNSSENSKIKSISRNGDDKDGSTRQNRLSPGTLAFLDDLHTSGVGSSKPPPKTASKASSKSSKKKEDVRVADSSVSSNTRSKQKRKSDETENLDLLIGSSKAKQYRRKGSTNSPLNKSNESDCLPPTPPGDKTCNSPLLSFKKTTPFKRMTPIKSKGSLIPTKIVDDGTASSKREDICAPPGSVVKEQNEVNENLDDGVVSNDPLDGATDKYTERRPCIDPNESGIPSAQEVFTIIDVCADKKLFDTFIKEWRTKTHYSISIACEKKPHEPIAGGGIGGNFVKGSSHKGRELSALGLQIEGMDLLVAGVAVCWENRDSYYVAFTPDNLECSLDDSLAPPPLDTSISIETRVSAVQSVLQQGLYDDEVVSIVMFDVKKAYSVLTRGCSICPRGRFQDPKIACWLLDPGAKEKNLHRMLHNYLPLEANLLEGLGGGIGYGCLGMTPKNPGSSRLRATTESVVILHLMEYFSRCLQKEDLHTAFQTIEMPSVITLARMELNGFGFSESECESQKNIMIAQLSALEDQAYQLAGHQFSLTATDDIAQVLFIELQLPPNGDPSSLGQPRPLGQKRAAAGGRKGRQKCQFSTSKDILEKLKSLHPLPGVILEWRRISSALTKVVFPLQKEKVLHEELGMYRIFTDCQLHTATGRVSLSEPNIQYVPKDFEISLPDIIGESPTAESGKNVGKKTKGSNSKLNRMMGDSRQKSKISDTGPVQQFSVSMRHAFVPFPGGVMLAADYSQLELRMIAHLSQDAKLMKILNDDGDVFKMIAAQWKCTVPEAVTAQQRQQAKQVCYGMIYGIGPKALGEQLEVDENDAAVFIETFKARYPGMRSYLRKTVEFCKENGYVQTILKRRRYLPTITSTNTYIRAHAERQAVNTTVQGSAADLVKCAMNRIDVKLSDAFPQTSYTHRHKHCLSEGQWNRKKTVSMPRGCFLVLQLHDELIYEVAQEDLLEAAKIIKSEMETAMKLSVRLPVKVKTGPSWGKLEDLEL